MSPATGEPDPLSVLTPEQRAVYRDMVIPQRRNPLGVPPAAPRFGAIDATLPVVEQPDPVADLVAAYHLIHDRPQYEPQPHYTRWQFVERAEDEIDTDRLAADGAVEWVQGHLRRAAEQLHRQMRERVEQLPPMAALCVHGAHVVTGGGDSPERVRFTVQVRAHVVVDSMPCQVPDSGPMTRYRRE